MAIRTIDGFRVPDDIDGYTPVAATYQAGTDLNQPGPALGLTPSNPGLTPIEVDETSWLTGAVTAPTIPPASQAKFRITLSHPSHLLADDCIRNFGQPGTSHWHMFYGNQGTNAKSTFASLRTRNGSGASGGPMNGTGYWVPAVLIPNAFGDGKTYAVRGRNVIAYYNDNDVTNTHLLTKIPPGFRYVFGQNMDDPTEQYIIDEVNAANAQAGTAGRYSMHPSGNNTSRLRGGWKMTDPNGQTIQTGPNADRPNDDYSHGFTNLDGTDPWEGAGEPSLHGGQNCRLALVVAAQKYWDGVNLWSPGGGMHLRYGIWDNVVNDRVGPHGWFTLPSLEQQINFVHRGWEDYRRWTLSSDAHFEMMLGRPIRPGESAHGDWMYGWQERVFSSAQTFCNGVGNNSPHECDSSTFSAANALKITDQVVTFDGDTSTPDGMWLVPDVAAKGPIVTRTRNF